MPSTVHRCDMEKHKPDERVVYLTFRNIFSGQDAHLRVLKKVQQRINTNASRDDVRRLIDEFQLDNVAHVAKTLLEAEVFESTLKAKIRFPEVFDVSPEQSAEREESEKAALRTEAEATNDAIEHDQEIFHTKTDEPSSSRDIIAIKIETSK
jgi:hypothetical protein